MTKACHDHRVFWNNDRRQNDRQPNYTGQVQVKGNRDGAKGYCSMWDNSGGKPAAVGASSSSGDLPSDPYQGAHWRPSSYVNTSLQILNFGKKSPVASPLLKVTLSALLVSVGLTLPPALELATHAYGEWDWSTGLLLRS